VVQDNSHATFSQKFNSFAFVGVVVLTLVVMTSYIFFLCLLPASRWFLAWLIY
jgi:hypothetical protein